MIISLIDCFKIMKLLYAVKCVILLLIRFTLCGRFINFSGISFCILNLIEKRMERLSYQTNGTFLNAPIIIKSQIEFQLHANRIPIT